MHHLTIHRDRLHHAMRRVQNSASRCLVHAAGFHADKPILHHVHPADAVFASEPVEGLHHLEWRHRPTVDGDAVAFLKIHRDVLRLVRRVLGRHAQLVHALVLRCGGVEPRVLEHASFERDVQQVAIHRVRLFHAGLDRYVFGHAVVDHLLTAGKLIAKILVPPWCNHLEVGRERGGSQFEAHLVVALAGGTVSDGLCPVLAGDLHHALGNQWTRDTCAEEILSLVNRAGLHHRENKISGELLPEVVDVNVRRSSLARLRAQTFGFLLLPDVGAKSDDLGGVLFLDPRQ